MMEFVVHRNSLLLKTDYRSQIDFLEDMKSFSFINAALNFHFLKVDKLRKINMIWTTLKKKIFSNHLLCTANGVSQLLAPSCCSFSAKGKEQKVITN